MDSVNHEEGDNLERISALNRIFDDLITDASDLVKDLFWGVKNYLFFGLVTFLFGVQEILYNIELMQDRLYIPLFIGSIMLFAGSVQIFNYFRLRSKYSRLFEVQSKLKKS
jgi:predicted transcriptional regulator